MPVRLGSGGWTEEGGISWENCRGAGAGYNRAVTAADEDEQFYRDTEAIAFPKLTDEQLALLEPLGTRRKLKRGDYLLKAGQREFPLTVMRSEERRVGKECRSRWSPYH